MAKPKSLKDIDEYVARFLDAAQLDVLVEMGRRLLEPYDELEKE